MANLTFKSDNGFTFTCEHCKRLKTVLVDKIPTCGFPLVFQCKQCECVTRLSKRKGEIQVDFDSLSAYYAKENPRMFETVTVKFEGLDESLVPDEWEKYFDQQPAVPGLIAQIDALYNQAVGGPDLYQNFFEENKFLAMASNIKMSGS